MTKRLLMTREPVFFSVLVITLLLLLAKNALAATPPVVITDLGTLGGTYSSASGVNARGQVVGISTTGDAAKVDGWSSRRIVLHRTQRWVVWLAR